MQALIAGVLLALGGVAIADRVATPAASAPQIQVPPTRPKPPQPFAHPAPETAQLGKRLAGTYRCKGVVLGGDGSSVPRQAKLMIELALDDGWIAARFVDARGPRVDEFRTFDGVAKQWTRIQLASTSAHVMTTSLGEQNGAWTWEGVELSPAGTTSVRDHEQITGTQIKLWGEALRSGTWQKSYETTCAR